MVCKYVVHINRLLSSRKVGTTKLALVSDSLVSKSLVSNVLFQGEFVVSCKRALVTGVQNFSWMCVFMCIQPLWRELFIAYITHFSCISLSWMCGTFVCIHIPLCSELFIAYITHYFCIFWMNDVHVSFQFVWLWKHLPTVGALIIINTSVLEL